MFCVGTLVINATLYSSTRRQLWVWCPYCLQICRTWSWSSVGSCCRY